LPPLDIVCGYLVEVRVSPRATARFDTIKNLVFSYITSSFDRISLPSTLEGWEDDPDLASSVERIVASESASPSSSLSLDEMSIQIHIYQPCDSDSFEAFANDGGGASDGEEVMAASICELPNRNWEGLWDSLIFAENIKMKLLDYIHATLVFSDANIDCE
jgi:pachytene checkpoint protein 2